MTYSIIAFDPGSGAYGVAIQSHWFNVGRDSPWVRFGVGAVVTQALTDPSYGWRGLDVMAAGVDAERALQVLLSDDPMADRRQVGMIDERGHVAVHTGVACVPFASHEKGDGWAVLGNLVTSREVIEAMASAYPATNGTVAERMVATLAAAEEAGGDLRGSQSAALRVVPGSADLDHGDEAGIDISIADHADPVGELRRLVEVDRSYRALRRGQTAVEDGRREEALAQFELASRLRHGVEVDFWRAIGLARLDQVAEALVILREAIAERPAFATVLVRVGETDPVAAQLATKLAIEM